MNNLSTLEPQYQVVISNYSEAGGQSDTEAVKNGECNFREVRSAGGCAGGVLKEPYLSNW